MIKILFKPTFLKQVNELEKDLVEEVFEKIELFKDRKNHKILKIHKLHGKLSGHFSFSVNYSFRIVFKYDEDDNAIFLDIGDHDLYK